MNSRDPATVPLARRLDAKVRRKWLSLRTRIILLALLAVLLPAGAMVGNAFKQRHEDKQQAEHNLTIAGRNAGRALEVRVNGTSQMLYGLAESPQLENGTAAACSAYLAEVLKRFPQYTGILTITPDGELRCDSLRTGRRLDLTDRAYFRQALASTEPVYEPVFGRLTGIGVLQVALAARDSEGKAKFVLLASLDLQQFVHQVALAQSYPRSVAAIFDAHGTMMAGYPGPNIKSSAGQNFLHSDLFRFARDGKPGDTAELIGLRGLRRIWARASLPEAWKTGLVVMVGAPVDELAAVGKRRMLETLAVLGIGSLLAFFAAVALFERAIRKPLGRVMAQIEQLRKGDFVARLGEPYPGGEIGEVMQAFDQTSAELHAQREVIAQAEKEAETLRHELEDRVVKRTNELADANKRLESFSYSVSHDLRTPLRAISGFSQILARRHRDHLNEEGRRYMDNIVRASAYMGRLIEDLLDYSRLGHKSLKRESVDLSGMVADMQRQLQGRIAELGATVQVAEHLPTVHGDATLLRQIIQNLLDNALTYFTPGTHPWVEIAGSTDQASGDVTIRVSDHGIGIASEHFDKIFGIFQRLHNEDEYPGTGIGLATVARAVELLGGTIRVESSPGVGSSFFVRLPQQGN